MRKEKISKPISGGLAQPFACFVQPFVKNLVEEYIYRHRGSVQYILNEE